ncbi:MAG: hypothetical protein ACI3XA_07225 [Clostridia bacterium]
MVNIKLLLCKNAINSFFIAKRHFVKFYYVNDKVVSDVEYDECIKIALTFLENSVELLLKVLLAVDEPTSIYEDPENEVILKAMQKVTSSIKLEDILIEEDGFRTITYSCAVKKYIKKFKLPNKVKKILETLGQKRNAITHFGLKTNDEYSEIIACFINTFDVIYNYLYPQLIKLDDIGKYFTDDSLYNISLYGNIEPLFGEDFIYNNIVDFLDELLESAHYYIFKLRLNNSNYNLTNFVKILDAVSTDNGFSKLIKNNMVQIDSSKFLDLEAINIVFDKQLDLDDIPIYWSYSTFYNISYFCNESASNGKFFCIDHNTNKIYYYHNSETYYMPSDQKEKEFNFQKDTKNGLCTKLELSKNNLCKIFIEQITDIIENGEDNENE